MNRVPTPWRVVRWNRLECEVRGAVDGKEAQVTGFALREDAERIVACVNACDAAGLTNEQLVGGILNALAKQDMAA